MKTETPAATDELDLIKVYIWVMVAMTIVLGGVVWLTHGQVQESQTSVEFARSNLTMFAESKQEIRAMLDVYTENKEDEARLQPLTWFSRVWQSKGIDDQSIRPQAWADPKSDSKGRFVENAIDLKFDNKHPLTRKQIGELCHEIERASTRLRLIELTLRRAGRKDSYEDDSWSGSIKVGYRTASIRGE